jgi:isoleucyl-tRNA synthetase
LTFDELKSSFTYPGLEEEILDYWDRLDPFHKGLEAHASSPRFTFYEGPPTANGIPGVHHVIARTIKDAFCRYKQMRGFLVERKAGWDTHGLPVEIEVETQLKLDSKADIEKYGIDKFNAHCRESVFKYLKEWDRLTKRIGYWLDLDNAYITCDNNYIETVWWILSQFFQRDLIYLGHKILPYCPRCGTGLSSHEVAQGYKEVKDPSIYVKAELVDEPGTKFLVWTTTPWTLISNVALAVSADADYVKVKIGDEKLILAEALAGRVLKEEFEILERFKGSELERMRYKPLFKYYEGKYDNIWYVTLGDFVTLEDGTGVVHMAPAFGADDYNVGQVYGLPVIQAVNVDGTFLPEITDYAGKFIKDADPLIIKELKERGILYKQEIYAHNYPHCWRCDSPLVYYARKSWYIKTSQFKEQLLARNSEINWVPPEIGSGRMGEWLENNVDWALSRERYWGTPLNIWVCEGCGKLKSIESLEMLRKEGINVPDEIDLHKPHVDQIELKCPDCGGVMKRSPEVIDCWFDSGSMPYAQFHYPFENKELFEKSFPAEFISEATDQTRGWFYSLLAISTLLFDKPAYKNVVVIGFILDRKGKKMSKSVGNIVDPWEVIKTYGADALRWYLLATSQPYQVTRFDSDAVAELQRKFLDTLKNSYTFFAIYANIDGLRDKAEKSGLGDLETFLGKKAGPPEEIDLWLESRLESLKRDVATSLDSYDITKAVRLISDFVIDELSNWYVRRCRRRYWVSGDSPDKHRAYLELYRALKQTCLLVAPVIPFFSEKLYISLTGEESVHLAEYPAFDESIIDAALEERMSAAIKLVSLGRSARNTVHIKVRQPLQEMRVNLPPGVNEVNVAPLMKVVAEEINVKEVSFIGDSTQVAEYNVVPNFKILGPKVGSAMKAVQEALKVLTETEIKRFLALGELKLAVDSRTFHFDREDVEVRLASKEGFAVASDGSYTVALTTGITPELRDEGFARELVNKIQNMRKEADFNVTDRISVYLETTEPVKVASSAFGDYIKSETLADTIEFDKLPDGFSRDWNINGEKATIVIRK